MAAAAGGAAVAAGSTPESRVNEKQDPLTTVVEPLVDSVSELVLAVVTQQFGNVQALCGDISDRTTTLVTVAQQVAVSSTDVDVQMEVAESINDIAGAVESLVSSFTKILAENTPATQQDFALAAKAVGDAINRVCQSTDSTSERKLQRAVQESAESTKEVVAAAGQGKDKLVAVAQLAVDRTIKLVRVAVGAAAATANTEKQGLLTEGADAVKVGGPMLIGAAKQVTEGGPHNVGASDNLKRCEADLVAAYEKLLRAASMDAKYFGKAAEMYEYVKRLIESATDLSAAAEQLMGMASSATQGQFMDAMKLTAGKALEMVSAAEAAAAQEQDAVKRFLILDAADELRAATRAYVEAVKAYRADPSEANRLKMEAAHERLQQAIQRVLAATKGEFGDTSTPAGRLALSSAALEGAATKLVDTARNDPANVQEAAAVLVGIADATADDIEKVAAVTTDPFKKKRLLENAAALRAGARALAAAAEKAAANRDDAAAQAAMDKAHADLLKLLQTVRRDAGLIPGSGDDEEAQMVQIRMAKGKEAEALAAAAREQAAQALRLADQADGLSAKIADPSKRAEVVGAVGDIRTNAAAVVAAADRVEAAPMELAAHVELQEAQTKLGQAVQKMVKATGANSDADVAAALAELAGADEAAAGGVYLSDAQAFLSDLVMDLLDTTAMDPKEVLQKAKELATVAAGLVKQLRAMAEASTDPIQKQKFTDLANNIQDNSRQVRILAMVRASGGPDKSNAVGNAVRTLQQNINESIREVRADELRNRFRSTVRQTMAMQRIASAWKKSAGL